MESLVPYIPIATTAFAVPFAFALYRRWHRRGGTHLLWWGIGVSTYAVGTAIEAAVTLFGWHPLLFRSWYIAGALLGGAPLAQGTVFLLLRRPVATRLTIAVAAVIAVGAVCVAIAPLRLDLVEPHRLTGKVLGWPWVRAFSPFVNLYAFLFLVGGAAWSAWQFAGAKETAYRTTGNVLIAIGSLLPGIGGTFTRLGYTEVLYVTEFIGLCLLYAGYRVIVTNKPGALHASPRIPAVS